MAASRSGEKHLGFFFPGGILHKIPNGLPAKIKRNLKVALKYIGLQEADRINLFGF